MEDIIPEADELFNTLVAHGWSEEGAQEVVRHLTPTDQAELFRRLQNWKPAKPDNKQPIPPALRKAVLERDAYRCQYCGGWIDLTVDHIVPEAHGGTLDRDNLQTLCRSCNSSKGTRPNRSRK